MLIFIENTPRAYAWGSREALPEMLGVAPTGEPQAELWLGAHPEHPAQLAKGKSARRAPAGRTLIDLIASDPERYGVNGAQLPFLLKVLAIGAPLSLQVHPDRAQAEAGFAAEEAAGVPRDAPDRNYGDARHKPELLVALSEVRALSGFRPLADARRDTLLLAGAARRGADVAGARALERVAERLDRGQSPDGPADAPGGARTAQARREFLGWAFSADPVVAEALAAVRRVSLSESELPEIAPDRVAAIRSLAETHPGDPGVLVSLLLHVVRLDPGDSVFLKPRQLHAYLSGICVEVMAASNNVLRAGLTAKHVDIAELSRVVDTEELAEPRFTHAPLARGLVAWEPPVPDFRLMRARVHDPSTGGLPPRDAAERISVPAPAPLVLIVTSGRVRIERTPSEGTDSLAEVARARRGQSLYVSAGEPISITGAGEVFLATIGRGEDAG